MPSKTTILEVLTQPNPPIDASFIKAGTNTTSPHWPHIDHWSRWNDFNAKSLREMYRSVVDADWFPDKTGSSAPSRWDRRVFDEDSMDHYFNRFMLPDINAALEHARHVLGMTKDFGLNIGRGGRCSHENTTDRRFRPDWSLCSDTYVHNTGLYQNLLPGDSKLSSKWRSDMYRTQGHHKWTDPVCQILFYMSGLDTRYGWLVTDAELVVFQVSTQLTGPGQAINRPTRQAAQGHDRTTSTGTTISQLSSALQSTSIGGDTSSSYRPPDGGVESFHVEYQTIPWEKHGTSRLSIRLAIFYLAMMAGYGARSLLTAYPAFDSWWWSVDDDSCFTHNSTGIPSKKRPQILEYPDPNGQRGPEWVTFTSDAGESNNFLTRASVRTLDVDMERQQHYYFDPSQPDENGNQIPHKIFVDENMVVFDQSIGQYGHFKRLVWVEATSGQEHSQPDKRRREKGDHSSSKKHKR